MAVAAALTATLFSGAVVMAYMIAEGTGQATQQSDRPIQGAPATVPLTVTAALGGGVGTSSAPSTVWALGDSQIVTLSIGNTSTQQPQISTITLQSWSTNNPTCSSSNATLAGTFTVTATSLSGPTIVGPGLGITETATVTMNDLSVDQSPCDGSGNPTFVFAVG